MLYLDDSPNEHLLLHWAVRSAGLPIHLEPFTTPEELQAHLLSQVSGGRRTYPRGSLALLDYHLNGTTSLALLHWIRAQTRFNTLPVVMYSGTEDPEIIQSCYSAGAEVFLAKPAGSERLQAVLMAISECLRSRPARLSCLETLPECWPAWQDVPGYTLLSTLL